jgi:hypothetical protein
MYVLVPERAQSGGAAVTARYAIVRFHLKVLGLSNHAGHNTLLSKGRSAISSLGVRVYELKRSPAKGLIERAGFCVFP